LTVRGSTRPETSKRFGPSARTRDNLWVARRAFAQIVNLDESFPRGAAATRAASARASRGTAPDCEAAP
jgi:hypothetical protein